MSERRFNSIATIIDGPPYEPQEADRTCPAKLRVDGDDLIWTCTLTIRAGRTKHRNVHDWTLS